MPPMENQQLSNALIALAEMYLTDACDQEDAPQKCEAYLNEALTHSQSIQC
jgi:hypothetical protein